jgi:hypothetical protein
VSSSLGSVLCLLLICGEREREREETTHIFNNRDGERNHVEDSAAFAAESDFILKR